MLTDPKDVAIRIFEPGNPGSARRIPDAQLLVLNEWIFLHRDAPLFQPADNSLNVVDLPTQDGALQWNEVWHF